MRCETCDFPLATEEDWKTIPPGEGEHLCWGACEPEDWRARALKAEAEVERLRLDNADLLARLDAAAFAVQHGIREVAERQREACAERLHALLREKKATAVWVGADEIRATPLVTEGDK